MGKGFQEVGRFVREDSLVRKDMLAVKVDSDVGHDFVVVKTVSRLVPDLASEWCKTNLRLLLSMTSSAAMPGMRLELSRTVV